jgi:lipoprotein-anchoring transpeptidase ErfK/SrfK
MRHLHIAISVIVLVLVTAVLTPTPAMAEPSIVVSVPDQTLAVVDGAVVLEKFRISTSKFGLGDNPNSYATPLGSLEIASKIGANAPMGTVFKSRQPTGEILKPNAPGRDPIVTRILWLRGLEAGNSRAYSRGIYIHGTPVEAQIGRPVSFGCIRMRSNDVTRLFNTVRVGTKIEIANAGLNKGIALATVKQQTRNVRLAANTRPRIAANSRSRVAAN